MKKITLLTMTLDHNMLGILGDQNPHIGDVKTKVDTCHLSLVRKASPQLRKGQSPLLGAKKFCLHIVDQSLPSGTRRHHKDMILLVGRGLISHLLEAKRLCLHIVDQSLPSEARRHHKDMILLVRKGQGRHLGVTITPLP